MKRTKGGRNSLLPSSLRMISSCLKSVSSNAGTVASTVRSAGASVAATITVPAADEEKDQVLWAGFDKLELSHYLFKNVLLLGYSNGFQVLEVEDASDVRELVSKRNGPVTFLQMQPIPYKSEDTKGFRSLHPMLLVVAGDDTNGSGVVQGGRLSALIKDNGDELQQGNCMSTPTTVRFFSFRSNSYVHVLRFRSAVYVVRCSPRVVAVALAAQIYCFDPSTLENKFSVLTYPIQGDVGVNIGYGPMAVGSRWLAYASNNPLVSNSGRLSPQNLTPSPGVSPSTSPGSGSFVARYAMESSKHLASGIINLGDMGYKTITKYCQDLLPDGSTSPLSPKSSRKAGRLISSTNPNEPDNAGMVVVKDFIGKNVISQFRAHSSPISALCFDPSGTLLVTASVHGNNINIFRIMPKYVPNGSGSAHHDWTSSHVHLYKLYRGLTSAVIQDISFSQYSQWISIVTARGTCHVYLLPPFGGDANLRAQHKIGDKVVLIPNLSLPWWSTSSVSDHQFSPSPPPITLSVVSRIKTAHSGWLNTVSTVAASAAGKTPAPSGAIATVFHNTMHGSSLEVDSKAISLEHLLVYAPSGHVIQHDLIPSVAESCDSSLRSLNSSFGVQDEELRVNAEPVQWWDVCRRLNWPERGEHMSSCSMDNDKTSELGRNASDSEENDVKHLASSNGTSLRRGSVKDNEKMRWYLSNAEVKGSARQLPIWQKSKIRFYAMDPPSKVCISNNDLSSGEIEIEKLPVSELEIRHKDLLPVFPHFPGTHSDSSDRGRAHDKSLAASSEVCQARDASSNDMADQQFGSVLAEHLCTENSTVVRKISLSNLGDDFQPVEEACCKIDTQVGHDNDCECKTSGGSMPTLSNRIPGTMPILCQDSNSYDSSPSHGIGAHLDATPPSKSNCISFSDSPVANDADFNNCLTGEDPRLCSSKSRIVQPDDRNSHGAVDIESYHQGGYERVGNHDKSKASRDADSNFSHHEIDKAEEDEDDEYAFGGVFPFSEEG